MQHDHHSVPDTAFVDSYSAILQALAEGSSRLKDAGKVSDPGLTDKRRRQIADQRHKRQMDMRRAARKDSRNGAYLDIVQKGSKRQSALATAVTIITCIQVLIVNATFICLFWKRASLTGAWPSDRLLLGWAASTVVEIIGLYAIVLRGVFPGSRADTWRRFKEWQ